jgi:hypothetical protein
MMFSTTQEVEEEQLDSLPLTVNEKFPAGNGIDPPAIACEPAAKLIASAPKNIRRVFIESSPIEIKNAAVATGAAPSPTQLPFILRGNIPVRVPWLVLNPGRSKVPPAPVSDMDTFRCDAVTATDPYATRALSGAAFAPRPARPSPNA